MKKYTKELLGLPEDAVPDDAFMALLVGTDSKAYRVKVQYPDGSPAVGYTISGINALPTTTLVTNSDGMVLGKSTSNSPTITVTKKYDDVKVASVVVNSTGTITDATIILEYDEDVKIITSSKTLSPNLSPKCQKIDYIIVGGGGGGCGDVYQNILVNGVGAVSAGAGGGGGNYKKGTMSFLSGHQLQISIGAGGTNGYSGGRNSGGTGGTTSIKNLITAFTDSASGGTGGTPAKITLTDYKASVQTRSIGGSGNGNGASGGYITDVTNRLDSSSDEYYGGSATPVNGIGPGKAIKVSLGSSLISIGGGGGCGSAGTTYYPSLGNAESISVSAIAGTTTGYGYGGAGGDGVAFSGGVSGTHRDGYSGASGCCAYCFLHVA